MNIFYCFVCGLMMLVRSKFFEFGFWELYFVFSVMWFEYREEWCCGVGGGVCIGRVLFVGWMKGVVVR